MQKETTKIPRPLADTNSTLSSKPPPSTPSHTHPMNLDIMDSRAVGPLSLSPHTTVETTTILRGLWLTMTILFARIALRPMWLMWGPDVAHYYVMCYVSDMHGDAKHW
jgi:hypothetical protein